jgi:hypothetical protein
MREDYVIDLVISIYTRGSASVTHNIKSMIWACFMEYSGGPLRVAIPYHSMPCR